MIPEEGGGGGVRIQPGSSETRRPDVRWNLIMNRFGKPVLSPNYRPDMPGSGRPVRKESFRQIRKSGTYFTIWDTARPGREGPSWTTPPAPGSGGWGDKCRLN